MHGLLRLDARCSLRVSVIVLSNLSILLKHAHGGSEVLRLWTQLAAFFLAVQAYAEPIRVGYIDYHPIVHKTDKGPSGYLIEYMKPIFEKAGFTLDWRDLPTHRGLIQLQQGQLDVFLTLLYSPERAQLINYSDVPIFQAQGAVCSKPGAFQLPPRAPLRIAHFLSTVIPPALKKHDLVPVTPEEVTQRMLTMLDKGRIDAIYYVYPEVLALSLAATNTPLHLECRVFQEFGMPVYMAYSKKMSADGQRRLNAALQDEKERHDFRTYIDSLLKSANVKHFHKVDAVARDFEIVKTAK
jgi:ABC-type amino acid transport substrate-binding protein